MARRWVVISLLPLLAVGYVVGSSGMWDRVSNDFMKEDKPYGPGDFRIDGAQVLSMKLTNPEVTTKPREERSDPTRAEFTEQWMYDPGETANRRSVRILGGNLEGEISRHFEEPAQRADWWLAPDWSTLYLTTGWSDRAAELPPGQSYRPELTQLFKSTDQGQEWEKLRWPEDQNITFLRFIDAQRGYLIGWGPRVWRTRDGGDHWDELPVPEGSRNPENPRQQFDLVALGQDHVLRMAFYDHAADVSRIYALSWGEDILKQAFTIPGHVVMDIAANTESNVYVLATRGAPYFSLPSGERDAPRPSVVWSWNGDTLHKLHEFPPGLKGYALYLTPSGGLLFDGVNESTLLGNDVVAVSYDGGGSWKIQDEGRSAQGGYYDVHTGTRWRVEGYSLYQREIP
ncbi:WD40/YVTN/BNR-like repeat-containing protein [Billgrantia ethanolica]|uniref:Glycosyl hydrolase n=1 Tax=Billgrantia ethanolica TaxID=2733486 RepID=A0ABS8ZYG3_9GAMM|nr:hypothetical protein [Halomonas ethanolica]MCE8001655.1 hypothetical protein [Halomonas ethanolica]